MAIRTALQLEAKYGADLRWRFAQPFSLRLSMVRS